MNSQKQNVFVTNSVLHKVLPGLCWQINQSPWKTERRKNIDGFRIDGFLIIWMTSWYKCVFEVERTYLVPVQRKCDMFGVEDKRKQLMNFGLENIIIIWNTRENGYQLWGEKKWKKRNSFFFEKWYALNTCKDAHSSKKLQFFALQHRFLFILTCHKIPKVV